MTADCEDCSFSLTSDEEEKRLTQRVLEHKEALMDKDMNASKENSITRNDDEFLKELMKENQKLEAELATVNEKSLSQGYKESINPLSENSSHYELQFPHSNILKEEAEYLGKEMKQSMEVKCKRFEKENKELREEVENLKKALSEYIQKNVELKEKLITTNPEQ